MADVFISYKRSESNSILVRRIAKELDDMGITCWYDTKDPDPGYFVQTIEQEILRCAIFLLIWDKSANDSEWCLTETYTAFEGRDGKNRPVRIPFQIGNFKKDNDMSFYMKRCQIFYGGDSAENADINELIVKIAACFQKPAPEETLSDNANPGNETREPKQPKWPVIFVIAFSLTIVVANMAVWRLILRPEQSDDRDTGDTPPPVAELECTLENGTLTISGEGSMRNYEYHPFRWIYSVNRWKDKNGNTIRNYDVLHIVIQEGVTTIGDNAFCGFGKLEDVTIPDSVTSIGDYAFWGCGKLEDVTIPDSVTSIGDYAFSECDSLKDISIPDSVTNIGAFAFGGCGNLENVSVSGKTKVKFGLGVFFGTKVTKLTARET